MDGVRDIRTIGSHTETTWNNAHKHINEEGELMTKETYIPRLMVLVCTFTLGTLIQVLLSI